MWCFLSRGPCLKLIFGTWKFVPEELILYEMWIQGVWNFWDSSGAQTTNNIQESSKIQPLTIKNCVYCVLCESMTCVKEWGVCLCVGCSLPLFWKYPAVFFILTSCFSVLASSWCHLSSRAKLFAASIREYECVCVIESESQYIWKAT